MWHIFISGWTLGLATGTTCLTTCAPIYIPYLLTEKRSDKQSFRIILFITLGRFFSYIIFGAVFGFVGSRIPTESRQFFTSIAYILLSVYLAITVLRIRRVHKNCTALKWMTITRNPFILGALTGISFCPAFLIAVSQAIDISGPVSGIILFIAFFLGTSLFILPITFLGVLSKIKNLRKIALVASILVAVFFIYKGVASLYEYNAHRKSVHNSIQLADSLKIVKPFLNEEKIFLIAQESDIGIRSIIEQFNSTFIKFTMINSKPDKNQLPDSAAVIYDINSGIRYKHIRSFKTIYLDLSEFHTDEHYRNLILFLKNVHFKYDPKKGYEFNIDQPPAGVLGGNR